MELDRFGHLVDAIYDAGPDHSKWPRVARELAKGFEAESCVLRLRGAEAIGSDSAFHRESRSFQDSACPMAEMLSDGKWARLAAAQPKGIAYFEDHAASNHMGGETGQLRHSLYALLALSGHGREIAIGIKNVGGGRDAFPAIQHELELLIPHIRRALGYDAMLGLGGGSDRFEWVRGIDALGLGAIVVDERQNVLYSNQSALLAAGPESGLTLQGGRCHIEDSAEGDLFKVALRNAITDSRNGAYRGVGSFRFVRLGSRLLLAVHPVFDCPEHAGATHLPAAIVLIGYPGDALSTVREAFSPVHNLTPSETRLVAALAKGERLNDYARKNEVSTNTVKTQLKSVFQKTGYTRQSELIRDVVSYSLVAADYEAGGVELDA